MSMPGPFEMIFIFLAILLLFGAKRLPEIGRALGKALKEFKSTAKSLDTEDEESDKG